MIDVFKKLAPKYQSVVRQYARKIWTNQRTEKIDNLFFKQAVKFANLYKRSLIRFYRKESINIFPGTIDVKANQWLQDQRALMSNIQTIADNKKEDIKIDLTEKLNSGKIKSVEKVQQVIDDLYLTPDQQKHQTVYKIFSFKDNMQKRADQEGDQSAFDLGADINNEVVAKDTSVYEWVSQEDSRVRTTHKKLNKKKFSFLDPPTTVDKYGNTHTGNPGSDWGCRCYAMPAKGKPRINYTVTG